MPLEFDERGLLPPGVHDASIDEVERCFGRFQRSDQRVTLWNRLRRYLTDLSSAEISCRLIIDGSFIMTKVDEPEDVDLLLLPVGWDHEAALRPYQYNVVSKRRVRQEFRFDLITVDAESPEERQWVEFFSHVNLKWCTLFGWPGDTTKGLVRVEP